MSPNGLVGNGSSAAANAVPHLNDVEPPTQRQTKAAPHYNSFPSYNAIRHEVPNSHAPSTQHTAGKPPARVLGPDLLRGLLMMFMAMDHLSIALRPWEHGLGRHGEQDGVPVTAWNRPAGYFVRSLTHLCAPGFTLLLGMGVVYLGRARRRKGWGAARLLRYYALRMAVLALVMVAHSVVLTAGQVWFLNIVLFALAVDYFLAGVLWLAVDEMEGWMAGRLASVFDEAAAAAAAACAHDSDSDAEQPLLHAGRPQMSRAEEKAARISWHLHNLLLVILSVVTIFWNIWLSQDQGQCLATKSHILDGAAAITSRAPGWDDRKTDKYWWLRLWFWETSAPGVLSAFPPLAWLSFAIVGVLYGRIVMRSAAARTPIRNLLYHVGAGLVFAVVFVLTRLLHFGNLSEHCLQTPENRAHPATNQYLVSPAAFFYTIKYPPDVAFWALTLAANFFLLAGLQLIPVAFAKRWLSVVLDFGTTSLFFYVVHMPVVFLTGGVMCALFGHDTDQEGPPTGLISSKVIDNVFGFFGVWALCLLIMWPLCRWYGQFKFGKPADSLWRIF